MNRAFASLILFVSIVDAFELPNIFKGLKIDSPAPSLSSGKVTSTKGQLLTAISGTQNGKTASVDEQRRVLSLVRQLETSLPPPNDLLRKEASQNPLDGEWYLQWTSPSEIGGDHAELWKMQDPEDKITTQKFQAQGSVSAAGIKVDTSNKPVVQTIDCAQTRVSNDITLDNGTRIYVAGSFRPSTKVPSRAVVAFDTADISVGPLKIQLGGLFALAGLVKGTKENGWLETTYIDSDLRIGRGNKGTCFVLTRNPEAVTP